jgi:hypothetical protein
MSKTILDDYNDGPGEKFDLLTETENYIEKIKTKDEFFVELENQFHIVPELGINKIDLFKVYCINFLNIPAPDFNIDKVMQYIDSENQDDFNKFLDKLKFYFNEFFGIEFSNEIDFEEELLYNLYNVLILYPENLILSYALYCQYYLDGYTFVDFCRNAKITEILELLGDDVAYDSKKYLDLLDKLNKEESRHVDDPEKEEENKRDVYFTSYLNYMFNYLEEIGTEDFFNKLNTANQSSTWEELAKNQEVFFDFHIDEDIFVYAFKIRYLDLEVNETSIIKIANIFFKKLKELAMVEFQIFNDEKK